MKNSKKTEIIGQVQLGNKVQSKPFVVHRRPSPRIDSLAAATQATNNSERRQLYMPFDEFHEMSSSMVEAKDILAEEVFNSSDTCSSFAEDIPDSSDPIIVQYHTKFVYENRLSKCFEGFEVLDNDINLFFSNFEALKRSSFNCVNLWIGVMRVRSVMINAIALIVGHPERLTFEYRSERLEELRNHVRATAYEVARAVQYMVLFNKHDERWKFQRRGFLTSFSVQLRDNLGLRAQAWANFLMLKYEFSHDAVKAFKLHLAKEFAKQQDVLIESLPKSNVASLDHRYLGSLKNMFTLLEDKHLTEIYDVDAYASVRKNLRDINYPHISAIPKQLVVQPFSDDQEKGYLNQIVDKDYLLVRIQLNIVQDIYGATNKVLGNPGPSESPILGAMHQVRKLLRKKMGNDVYSKVKELDDTIWPHQKGMPDLGPFSLINLQDWDSFLEIDTQAQVYKLSKKGNLIKHMSVFNGVVGHLSRQRSKTSRFSAAEKLALNIPKVSTEFVHLFPLFPDSPGLNEGVQKKMDFDSHLKCAKELTESGSPLHGLALYGGFMFFGPAGPCGVSALVDGDCLYFDGPYFIPDPDAFNKLEAENIVVCPVKMERASAAGAIRYSWITGTNRQHELLDYPSPLCDVAANKTNLKKILDPEKFLALAFEYANDDPSFTDARIPYQSVRRTYFQVQTFEGVGLKMKQNNNTPILSKLRHLIESNRNAWSEYDKYVEPEHFTVAQIFPQDNNLPPSVRSEQTYKGNKGTFKSLISFSSPKSIGSRVKKYTMRTFNRRRTEAPTTQALSDDDEDD